MTATAGNEILGMLRACESRFVRQRDHTGLIWCLDCPSVLTLWTRERRRDARSLASVRRSIVEVLIAPPHRSQLFVSGDDLPFERASRSRMRYPAFRPVPESESHEYGSWSGWLAVGDWTMCLSPVAPPDRIDFFAEGTNVMLAWLRVNQATIAVDSFADDVSWVVAVSP